MSNIYTYNLDGQPINLNILDTAGEDDYVTLRMRWL